MVTGNGASFVIGAMLVGPAAPFGSHGGRSAIVKRPAAGPVRVGSCGIAGDEQADLRRHGGPEKAVHHYAFDHYAYWERTLTSVCPTVLAPPGAFGENVSTSGVTEADVCVGDVWRAGTALLQVSQGRQPCFKLNQRFELADMARRVQSSGRTGWYYRVVQPGTIGLGDPLRLVERTHPRWSLSRLLRVFYVDRTNRSELEEITALRALSPSWRAVAAKRLESGTIEDWALRLGGDLGGPVDVA